MEKEFDDWNNIKQRLEYKTTNYLFKTSELWWCSIGINIGTESCGKGTLFRRPVLVLKKLSRNSFIGLPITSKVKHGSWFTKIHIHGKLRFVMLHQIRIFHTNRFERRFGTLDARQFLHVKEKLKNVLELF